MGKVMFVGELKSTGPSLQGSTPHSLWFCCSSEPGNRQEESIFIRAGWVISVLQKSRNNGSHIVRDFKKELVQVAVEAGRSDIRGQAGSSGTLEKEFSSGNLSFC